MSGEGELPRWLSRLLEETFFAGCGTHRGMKKNEKKILCLQCSTSLCSHCAQSHPPHPFLQIRRYVYSDVVRLDELKQLIDCSFIQPYTINSAKVIFLKSRPQSKLVKSSVCHSCERNVQESFYFCSLTCKVEHVMMQGHNISTILRYDESESTFAQFQSLQMEDYDQYDDEVHDHDQITTNSIMKDSVHCMGSSSGSSTNEKSDISHKSEDIKKKGSSRRKGTPHRAPIC